MSTYDEDAALPPSLLSDMINKATQQQHTNLNRLISSRLPLALPPNASQPDLYLLGISQIAELFFAFESLWDEITSTSHMSSLDNSTYGNVDAYPHPREDALLAGLRTLRPIGLARTGRLQDDLAKLRHVCGSDEGHGMSDVVADMVTRMEHEVRDRPHLLIAYAFTLYLAVLSGGRHIRSELCRHGVDFWTGRQSPTVVTAAPEKTSSWDWSSPVRRLGSSFRKAEESAPPLDRPSRKPASAAELAPFSSAGLSVWFFPGPEDGEDLRKSFKNNLHELQKYISPAQEDEIVAEAQMIFSRIQALVGELDAAVALGEAFAKPTLQQGSPSKGQWQDAGTDKKADTILQSTASAIAMPVLRDRNGVALNWYLGLGLLMCGISYGAMVYGYNWSS